MDDQHQMRAPVIRRHDGPLAVLANHRVYLKVSKTLLLIVSSFTPARGRHAAVWP